MPKTFLDLDLPRLPVPVPNPGSPHFPSDDELPDWLVHEYLDYCRPLAHSPDAFLLTAVLTCMSAVIGPRAYVPLGNQKLRPSLSGLILGPSTISGKSTAALTAIETTLGPLRERIEAGYEQDVSNYRDELEHWEATEAGDRGRRPTPPLHVYIQAPNDMTGAAMNECLSAQNTVPEDKRFGMLQYSDEASSLLDSRKSKYNADIIQRLTSLHDCSPYGVRRKGDGFNSGTDVFLLTPFVNILGCSTPQWFTASLLGDAVQGGFLARFMIVQCDLRPSDAVKPPADPPAPNLEILKRWQCRVASVFEGDISGPWRMSKGARAIYSDLYDHLWDDEIRKDGDNWEARSAIAGRLTGAARKLALIFEAFETRGRPDRDENDVAMISVASMRAAVRVSEFYMAEMSRIAGSTLAGRNEALEAKYLNFVGSGKKRSEGYTLCKNSRRGFRVRDFDELLDSLVEQRKIVVVPSDGKGGAEIHRLWTAADDAPESSPEAGSQESAVAEAAAVFAGKAKLRVVAGGSDPNGEEDTQ